MSDAFRTVVFYFPKMLSRLTDTAAKSWKETNGPESRCGLDYYFRHSAGREAYINVDQEIVTINIDGEIVFSGNLMQNARLKDCVTEIVEGDVEPPSALQIGLE